MNLFGINSNRQIFRVFCCFPAISLLSLCYFSCYFWAVFWNCHVIALRSQPERFILAGNLIKLGHFLGQDCFAEPRNDDLTPFEFPVSYLIFNNY